MAGGKIAALLQAFGMCVGTCGLANVLQCAVGDLLVFQFYFWVRFFPNLAPNGWGFAVNLCCACGRLSARPCWRLEATDAFIV